MRKPVRTLALLSVAALAAGMGLSGSANAAPAGDPEVLAKDVPAPLSLAVAEDGSAYVTANFAGNARGTSPGPAAGGSSSTSRRRAPRSAGCPCYGEHASPSRSPARTRWSSRSSNGGKPTHARRRRQVRDDEEPRRRGRPTASGRISRRAPRSGRKEIGPPTYTGIVDSHPYSTYTTDDGVYVGEAAGNDILWVGNDGKIKIVAVLPPTPVTITAGGRRGLGLPACTVGLDVLVRAGADRRRARPRRLALRQQPAGRSGGRQPRCAGSRLQGEPEVGKVEARRRRLHQHGRRGRRRQR